MRTYVCTNLHILLTKSTEVFLFYGVTAISFRATCNQELLPKFKAFVMELVVSGQTYDDAHLFM